MRYIPADYRQPILQALDVCKEIQLIDGVRHARVAHRSGDFIPIPSSPSDRRALLGFRSQLRRLCATGHGLIAARRRHC